MFGQRPEIEEREPGSSRRGLPRHCVRPARRLRGLPQLERTLRRAGLRSVYEEARAPNRWECSPRRHLPLLRSFFEAEAAFEVARGVPSASGGR